MPDNDPCAALRSQVAEAERVVRQQAADPPEMSLPLEVMDLKTGKRLGSPYEDALDRYYKLYAALAECVRPGGAAHPGDPPMPEMYDWRTRSSSANFALVPVPDAPVLQQPLVTEDATAVPAFTPTTPGATEDATVVPEFTPTTPGPREAPGQPATSGWTPGAYEFKPATDEPIDDDPEPGYFLHKPSKGFIDYDLPSVHNVDPVTRGWWPARGTWQFKAGLGVEVVVVFTAVAIGTVAVTGIGRDESPSGVSNSSQAAGPLTATGNFIVDGNACQGPLTLKADWTFGGAKPGDKVVIDLTGDSVPSSATAVVGSDGSVHLSYPIPPAKPNTQLTYTGTVQSVGGRKPINGYGWSKNTIVRCTALVSG